MKPWGEVPVGTTVTLAPSASIEFLHYESCRTFTVRGGTITFPAGTMPTIDGAASRSDVRVRCPEKIYLGRGAGSMINRRLSAAPMTIPMGLRPIFVVAGEQAQDIVALRFTPIRRDGVALGDDIVVTSREGLRFHALGDGAPLAAGLYKLVLVSAPGARPVEESPPTFVQIGASSSLPGYAELLVINTD
jgi:hypothetical protein